MDGSGDMDDKIDDVYELTDERQSQRGCRGVGFVLSERLFECVNGYKCICSNSSRSLAHISPKLLPPGEEFRANDPVADGIVTATECMIEDGKEKEIAMDQIMKVLKRMKAGKAGKTFGKYDRVSSEMLRGGGSIVIVLLYKGKGSRQALQSLYRNSSACVRINRAYTDLFDIRRGVRQGCVASPWLFNLFMDSCLYDLQCAVAASHISTSQRKSYESFLSEKLSRPKASVEQQDIVSTRTAAISPVTGHAGPGVCDKNPLSTHFVRRSADEDAPEMDGDEKTIKYGINMIASRVPTGRRPPPPPARRRPATARSRTDNHSFI
ncbi:hypothetical protein EVAR_56654_1 [Eumeta japonica]|uniref:Uncharacterized protein n=1 Tax=Eumeta variegata TaxID=151549 RepID=A0A4C1YWL3_EUMVA|nr:hypothetical protein EVAR_56654_1 [Eumeta japonica]